MAAVAALAALFAAGLSVASPAVHATSTGVTLGWGNNNQGELADTPNPDYVQHIPTVVPGLANQSIVAIDGGSAHGVALRSDGTVLQWGNPHDGTAVQTTPVVVPYLHDVVAVAAGFGHDLALESDGSVWAWGDGGFGVLGVNSQQTSSTPVAVHGLGSGSGVVAIDAGPYQNLALKSDGSVVGWGRGDFGQLGTGVTQYALEPVPVAGLQTGVTQVASGNLFVVARMSDGTLRSMGRNVEGELGDGTTTSSNTPVTVSGLTTVAKIAATENAGVALKTDGTLWKWGGNWSGEIGDGTTLDRHAPVQVTALPSDIAQIATGAYQTFVVTSTGILYQWGYADAGQGVEAPFQYTPVVVAGIDHVTVVGGGVYFSLAIGFAIPTVQVGAPLNQHGYTLGQSVNAAYSCADVGGPGLASCVGDVPVGAAVDMSAGIHYFTVTATDIDGRVGTKTVVYDVQPPPEVRLDVPLDGAVYPPSPFVLATFTCSMTGATIADCSGTVPSGAPINMSLGTHTFSATALDGGGRTSVATATYTVRDSASGTVPPGGTVATVGSPTPDDPVQTSVSVPAGGNVSIVESGSSTTVATGYSLAAQQVDITAPASTPGAPLTLRFDLDGSALAPLYLDASSVVVLRDGVPIADCIDPSVLIADPDPCVFERLATAGGGAQIGVYSSHASAWNFGAPPLRVPHAVRIAPVSTVEGDGSKLRSATFAVTLDQPATQTVTVHYSTSGGSATSGVDFRAKSGTVTFSPALATGKTPTVKLVTVPIVGDAAVEGDETFSVTLSSPTGGYTIASPVATGTIIDDDPGAGLRASVGDASVWEGDVAQPKTNAARVWVNLSAPVPAGATVSVKVSLGAGTASAGSDYKTFATKTLAFLAGQFQKAITVSTYADTTAEPNEALSVVLSAPSSGLTIGRGTGAVTILNDD